MKSGVALSPDQPSRFVVDFLLDLAGRRGHVVADDVAQRVVPVFLTLVGHQVEEIQIVAEDARVELLHAAAGDDHDA